MGFMAAASGRHKTRAAVGFDANGGPEWSVTWPCVTDYHSSRRSDLGMNILSPGFTPKASYHMSM